MNFPKSLLIFCLTVGIFSCQGGSQTTDPVSPTTPPKATIGKPKIKSGDNLNPVSDEVLDGVEQELEAQMPGKEVTATPSGKVYTPAQVDSIRNTLPGMKRPPMETPREPLSDDEKISLWDNTILKQMNGVLDILCKEYKKGTLDRDKKLQYHESGLKTFPVKAGGGPRCRPDSYVSIKFVAMTVDGQKFDANFAKDRFLRFKMGAGEVIPGIEEALLGLGAGAKGVFFIPPHLAFGDKGRVGVPPNTEVAYLISLEEVN